MKNYKYDFLVVGAGIVGLCTAFHLSKYGRVCVIEQSLHIYGATSKSGAGFRSYDIDPDISKNALISRSFYHKLSPDINFRKCESFYVLPSDIDDSILSEAKSRGYSIRNSLEMNLFRPEVNWNLTGFFVQDSEAGYYNSGQICSIIEQSCIQNGVNFEFGCKLIGIEELSDYYKVSTSTGLFYSENIFFATGYWTPAILSFLGINHKIKNRAISIHYSSVKKYPSIPFIVEHESGFHMRPNGDNGVLFGVPQLDWNFLPDKIPDRSTTQLNIATKFLENYLPGSIIKKSCRTITSADSYLDSGSQHCIKIGERIHVMAFGNGASFKYAPSVTLSYVHDILNI